MDFQNRCLIAVVLNGRFRVSKYCRTTDGNPPGQGKALAEFLCSDRFDLTTLKQRVREHTMLDYAKHGGDDYWRAWWQVEEEDFAKSSSLNPKMGADILEKIQSGEAPESMNDLRVAADFLACDWVYVIDLDAEMVEVYAGYGIKPDLFERAVTREDRFFFLQEDSQRETFKCPPRILASCAFSDFTAEAMERLSAQMHIGAAAADGGTGKTRGENT